MKKVLIVSHFMEIGGVERALLGLLNGFDCSQYSVDLFLFRHEGELLQLVPEKIHLLPTIKQYTALARPMKCLIKKRQFLLAGARMIGKCAAKSYNRKQHYGKNSAVEIEYSHKFIRWLMPQIQSDTEYDLAISFLTPHYFVAEKVRAKKKIAWIHTDYSFIQINIKSELKMWQKYDKIASISESCTTAFLKTFPLLEKKVILIENLLAVDFLKRQSLYKVSEISKHDNTIKLLSIGRYCEAKNFDNVPEICRKIIEKGLNVSWYIIGFGGDEDLIKQKIVENGMEKHVILLGKKENPYPYIVSCDWYIQPSRFEGKAVTVREAQALHKPVIITNYATAKSQLQDGFDGIIVPQDNEECADAIFKALNNNNLKKTLIENTYCVDYSNIQEMQKIYALMEE